MLAVKKVRSYQIPDDMRELIATACDHAADCDRAIISADEIQALRKVALLFRSDSVSFSVAMAGDHFEFLGDDGRQ